MIMPRRLEVKSFIKKKLSRGRAKQIFAPHNLGDLHLRIINDNGKLVGRQIVVSPDDKIPEVAASFKRMRTGATVVERDLASIGHAKTPVDLPPLQFVGSELPIATRARIDRSVIRSMRSIQRLHDIAPGTDAGEYETRSTKPFEGSFVEREARALKDRLTHPPKTKPGEVLNGGFHKFRSATSMVEIIDAQQEFAVRGTSSFLSGPESARVTEMEISSRRWRKASPI
jgi:hypothetical protein